MRTSFRAENGEIDSQRTNSAHDPATSDNERRVRFPKVILNKKTGAKAVIYGKSKGGEPKKGGGVTEPYPFYRICWRTNGKRQMQSFAIYSDALKAANDRVKQLGTGSALPSLSEWQARDARSAFDVLRNFYVKTGRKVSLLDVVTEWASVISRLPQDRTLGEVVEIFGKTLATLQRIDLGAAVEKFLLEQEPRTKPLKAGERPQLDPKWHYNRSITLRRFANVLKNTAVADITKDQIDLFFNSLGQIVSEKSRNKKPAVSPKTRNHNRASIREFLRWCVRKDYLSHSHRLLEAESMKKEKASTEDTQHYSPEQFAKLLANAKGPMLALVATGGFCGLRTAELLRLDWQDVFRVEGHVEVTKSKSKTRQRRLVPMCTALAQWLAPYKGFSGKIWTGHEATFQEHFQKLCEQADVCRITNGLRHAFCTYLYALHGEDETAKQAGNSPEMIHQHYKGLAGKDRAEQWFNVSPTLPENVKQMPRTETRQASA